MPEPVEPLRFVAGDDAAVCDPVNGVCAVPDAESEVKNDDGTRGEGAASAR